MMRYRFPRPKWLPGGPEGKPEPLTLPASIGTYAAVAGLCGGLVFFELLMGAIKGPRAVAPSGVLANGVVQGCFAGLTAIGLILIYRTTRIINFAQASLGSSAAFFATQMVIGYDFPLLVVVPIGLVIAMGAGALAELLLRRFSKAPRLVVTIATIALGPLLGTAMSYILQQLNPLPPGADPAAAALKTVPMPFPEIAFRLPPLTFNFGHILAVVGSLVALAGVTVFLRRTRMGAAVRGAAENSDAAWLLGINVRFLSTVVWSLAALLSGLGAVFALMINGVDTNPSDGGASFILPALVAAMVAGMETMPLAFFFAVWFAVAEEAVRWAYPDASFHGVALLAVVVIALLLQRQRLQRRESKAGSSWEAAKDVRPTPRELRSLPVVRNARYALPVLGLLAVGLFPWITSAGQLHAGGIVLIYVMIAISLLLVTGWAGQVSLGQFALVALGAVISTGLTARYHVNFWIALPVASLAGAAVAVALGLPSLRLRGLYLAAVTLCFALAVPSVLFNEQYFGFLQATTSIDRPHLFFINFDDERWFFYLLLACAVAWTGLAWRLRRSRTGRVLIALRDNEQAAQSVGVSALRTRLAVFALSGFIAAFAGVMLAHFQQAADAKMFGVGQSLSVFLFVVIGGLGSVSGAVLGAVFGASVLYFAPAFSTMLTGTTAFVIMAARPDGLAGILYSIRDAILRVIALRQRIVVPSLFSDYDAEAQKRREMPLTQPSPGQGLGSLPLTQRYAKQSFLWNRGREA